MNAAFDPRESLLARKVGAEYRYHTNLRSTVAHPTRDSLDYALLLLEADAKSERARAILDRILKLQEADPESKWYGLWGYYLEEPAPKMSPADWNWADFLGALLLEIEFRRGASLDAASRQRVKAAIRHAAYSVRRRNVAMTYTNIAVQGTFVTLAAAEVLDDADLLKYAKERLVRFARTVDETGSFTEYNSPTYANVTLANLTRIRMFVKDAEAIALARRIEDRAWLHLSRHWHEPTRQLAGPMSRCYSTDIGQPAWIQKALGGGVPFVEFEEIRTAGIPGEVARLDYRCPSEPAARFVSFGVARQHRELFAAASAAGVAVQGTTYLGSQFCLGSVNQGSFWVQSRPLVAYWGGLERPARAMQVRVLKDDYDFASALLYSTQEDGFVLGSVAFRSPGGDKHPSLDPVKDGRFTCSRLRLRFDFSGLPFNAPFLVDGREPQPGVRMDGNRVAIDVGGVQVWIRNAGAVFGKPATGLSVEQEGGLLTVSIDFINSPEPRTQAWPGTAYGAFALIMLNAAESLARFDEIAAGLPFAAEAGETLRIGWSTPDGILSLEAPTRVGEVAALNRSFAELRGSKPVEVRRLSNEPLVGTGR